MDIMATSQGDVSIIEIKGRLDTKTTGELEQKIVGVLEGDSQKLLVDMADLDYINSSGLRVLVMAYQRLKQSGGTLAISGTKDYILEVFEIAGYHRLFNLYHDQQEALAAF
jgi:anti-sigma B factor antagonist